MRSQLVSRSRTLVLALLLASPESAAAVDGVIEINQTRALARGVTAGDTPGFPITLSRPGSYRLTSNLDVSGQPDPLTVTAIDFPPGAAGATLDLNGFSVLGPPCPSLPCTPEQRDQQWRHRFCRHRLDALPESLRGEREQLDQRQRLRRPRR